MKNKILVYQNPLTGKILYAEIISLGEYGVKIKSSEFVIGLVPYKDVIKISDLLDKYLYEKYHTKNILRISPFNLRDDAKEIKAERLKPIEEIPIPEPRDFTLSEKETLKGAWLSTSEGTNILFPDGTEDKQLKNFLQMSDYTPDDNTKVEITITYPDGYSNKLSTSVNELIKNDTQLNFWLDLYKLHSWFAPSNSIQDYYRYISFIIHFKLIDVGVIPIGPEKETNHER